MNKTRLLSIEQFCIQHPSFSPGGIRHLVFNAHKNGFNKCIRRIGRRVLIDEAAFFSWVEMQNDIQQP